MTVDLLVVERASASAVASGEELTVFTLEITPSTDGPKKLSEHSRTFGVIATKTLRTSGESDIQRIPWSALQMWKAFNGCWHCFTLDASTLTMARTSGESCAERRP